MKRILTLALLLLAGCATNNTRPAPQTQLEGVRDPVNDVICYHMVGYPYVSCVHVPNSHSVAPPPRAIAPPDGTSAT